jgi:hypothetical protein
MYFTSACIIADKNDIVIEMEAESWKTVYTSKHQNFGPSVGKSALIIPLLVQMRM